jgi:hypothetical protein
MMQFWQSKSGLHGCGNGTWIALLLTLIFVSGCRTAPEPIYCEPVIIEKDRIVSVPESLTAPVEIVDLSQDFDAYELGAAYKAQRVRALQCNGKLSEIAKIVE